MSIEVKQLIIKSDVKDNTEEQESSSGEKTNLSCEMDAIKSELLNQCRKMIIEELKKSKER
ncbi:hypothetical protein H4J58_03985 [Colwellia sp. MB3u-70]|uniref:DUF5908 family protein n=1 Tax=unclassified Colwellia TaxID=196834 RepID=UPI0015F614A9|nr:MULTISPECIES: DUF5908 family protein [unclassified Colwellia]MBA6293750.1 hypothetical protein [Colwellia sp. MB3u-8]MBA6306278.1 hypothetical protein [Colwellia sp. MB3u-70]